MVIWKAINDYEGLYEISNIGQIKSLYTNKILKNNLGKSGYYQIQLFKNKQFKQLSIHRLVAEMFIPNPENKPQVNHINAIKKDNRVENLEWVTGDENMSHAKNLNLFKNSYAAQKNVCKKVKDTNTNIVYDSIKIASEELNINYTSLRSMLCGKTRNSSGIVYVD